MKLSSFLAVFLTFCIGCAEEFKPQASPEQLNTFSVGYTFEHEIEGCTVDASFENTCTDWMTLLENGKVDYLIGGGDIINRGSRETKGDTLYVYTNFYVNPLRLIAIDVNTLRDVSTGNIWVRAGSR